MLRFLSIKRLAVIDAVEVEFDPGFNVLTGETGAGKSILVEAVGLLLGGRASGDLVRTGEEVAAIEAIFQSGGDELVVRREITAQGRSRAFINGNLATATALKDLSARLIELHGQHEHQTLLDPTTHLDVIDAFGGLERWTAATASAFDAMRAAAEELTEARKAIADRESRLELVAFQVADLDRAAPRAGEDEELTAARQVLANAERIERLCAESYASLYDSDGAVLSSLGGVWKRVAELATFDPRFQSSLEARDGIKAQLEELAMTLRRYVDTIEASPARLEEVEERLGLLERLKRKYGPTLADVIGRHAALRAELVDLEGSDERITKLERRWSRARQMYLEQAEALGRERRRVAVEFVRQLERALADLAMEQTRLEVRFSGAPPDETAWCARGIDTAEFFVSPNPGEELRPLARVVSGGELSRSMLAIKTLMFASRLAGDGAAGDSGQELNSKPRLRGAGAPGLIFDEVDAGIGGRVADVVGRKLRALGSAFQVLCITHLPQIAAYADTHFAVEKSVDRGRTHTTVTRLSEEQRVDEIARMLGGEAVSPRIRESAREMITERRGKGPTSPKGESKSKGESESAKAKGEAQRTQRVRR
jgi:DNA repair protein RecN (Recombination protein N)